MQRAATTVRAPSRQVGRDAARHHNRDDVTAEKTLCKHQALLEARRIFPTFAHETRSAMLNGRAVGVIGVGSIWEVHPLFRICQ